MAFSTVYLKNPRTGQIRQAPVGFSWTTLFFGFIPALFRSDWVGAAIQLIFAIFTAGLSGLVFMFIYNKWHLNRLLNNGFEVTGATMDVSQIGNRIGRSLPMIAS